MPQKIMTHIVQPDGSVLEIHDHGRGQANGVATLNAQGKLAQTFNGYASQLPSPDNNEDSLMVFIVKTALGV